MANAAGHADRHVPLKNYCTGLLLSGERKSVEPMAARLAPDNVGRMHQSLHQLVADAPWSDEAILGQVRGYVLPAMRAKGPVQAWFVDDTGFPKKGSHSVGVARQYCGQIGKQDNCRVAVSLSISTNTASLPIAFRLYLPEVWANDAERRGQAEGTRKAAGAGFGAQDCAGRVLSGLAGRPQRDGSKGCLTPDRPESILVDRENGTSTAACLTRTSFGKGG